MTIGEFAAKEGFSDALTLVILLSIGQLWKTCVF